jgi:hypothetical protein
VDYAPNLVEVAPASMAAISARAAPDHVGHVVFAALDRVHAALRAGDFGRLGGDVVLCEQFADGILDLKIGVQLERPFPGLGRVEPWATPGGEAVCVTHAGAYSQRSAAHAAARESAQRLGRDLTGVYWEVHGAYELGAGARPINVYHAVEPARG